MDDEEGCQDKKEAADRCDDVRTRRGWGGFAGIRHQKGPKGRTSTGCVRVAEFAVGSFPNLPLTLHAGHPHATCFPRRPKKTPVRRPHDLDEPWRRMRWPTGKKFRLDSYSE